MANAPTRTCSAPDCTSPVVARGYCRPHYERARRGRPLDGPLSEHTSEMSTCEATGCGNTFFQRKRGSRRKFCSQPCKAREGKRAARESGYVPVHRRPDAPRCTVDGCTKARLSLGLCAMHYARQKRYGDPGEAEARYRPGEWRQDSSGYLRRNVNGRAELQHRVAMEEYLGRPLLAHENVHHKNGVRTDNRIENLELWTESQPTGQRVADKIAWARELLDLYADLPPEAL